MFGLRAFCYVERLSRTLDSALPVEYYVFEPDILTALRTGIGRIFTTDREKFEETIRDYLQKGFDVVTDRLPFPMFSTEIKSVESIEIVRERRSYSRV